jgi:hypothetical protein
VVRRITRNDKIGGSIPLWSSERPDVVFFVVLTFLDVDGALIFVVCKATVSVRDTAYK